MNKNRRYPERVPYFKIKNVSKLNETTNTIENNADIFIISSEIHPNSQKQNDSRSTHFQAKREKSEQELRPELVNSRCNEAVTTLKQKIEKLTKENECLKHEQKESALKLLNLEETNAKLIKEKDVFESQLIEKSKSIADLEEKLSNLNKKHLESNSLFRNSIQFKNHNRNSRKRVCYRFLIII